MLYLTCFPGYYPANILEKVASKELCSKAKRRSHPTPGMGKRQEELRKQRERTERIRKEWERRMNPKTKEDFDLLYSHLESKLIEMS